MKLVAVVRRFCCFKNAHTDITRNAADAEKPCTTRYHLEGGKVSASASPLYRHIVCGGVDVSVGQRVVAECFYQTENYNEQLLFFLVKWRRHLSILHLINVHED